MNKNREKAFNEIKISLGLKKEKKSLFLTVKRVFGFKQKSKSERFKNAMDSMLKG